MDEYDQVKLIVEKECYAKDGVHKDMVGWICFEQRTPGSWLVSFEQYGSLPEIACISVDEADLVVITPSDYLVKNNTKIAKAWFRLNNKDKTGIKTYDRVELIVEKDCYAEEEVHKGMIGWICYEQQRDGYWTVCFDQDEYFDVYPIISVKETDFKVIA